MSKVSAGMLAKSLAGHDKDSIYFIQYVKDECIYLVDGRLRTVDKPKCKNIKHIQVIRECYHIEETQSDITKNEAIKKLIKQYKKEHSN